jgi:uncharacterized DUF497 family protein
MKFEWDEDKAASNLAKHDVEFSDAILVFSDPLALFEKDLVDEGEQRRQVLGFADAALLIVIHVVRDRDAVKIIRLISARHANRKEKRHYERENN